MIAPSQRALRARFIRAIDSLDYDEVATIAGSDATIVNAMNSRSERAI